MSSILTVSHLAPVPGRGNRRLTLEGGHNQAMSGSTLSDLSLVAVAAAGVVAGAVNSVAGGGSLLTFPVLLGLGLDPLAANVTNTVGLVAGQLGGGLGYRRELRGQSRRLLALCGLIGGGGVVGAVLLLTTPVPVFQRVVPYLIIAGCVALALQPRLVHAVGAHRGERSWALRVLLVAVGTYGGYFGAALGVMLLALLAVAIDDTLQRLNAAKVVLSGVVNTLAATLFVLFGPVHWSDAAVLAVASLSGGALGAILGRRAPPQALRLAVAGIGVAVAAVLIVRG